jgi:hypothetical protein
MDSALLVIMLVVSLVFAIAQVIAGYEGIAFHLGTIWAILAVAVAFFLRFTLPLTIGAFFGAMDVWGWHWAAALVFAVPGIIFAVPGVIVSMIEGAKSRFR